MHHSSTGIKPATLRGAIMEISETPSGLTVVQNGPLVTPPQDLVVITAPEPEPAKLLGPNGEPIASA